MKLSALIIAPVVALALSTAAHAADKKYTRDDAKKTTSQINDMNKNMRNTGQIPRESRPHGNSDNSGRRSGPKCGYDGKEGCSTSR